MLDDLAATIERYPGLITEVERLKLHRVVHEEAVIHVASLQRALKRDVAARGGGVNHDLAEREARDYFLPRENFPRARRGHRRANSRLEQGQLDMDRVIEEHNRRVNDAAMQRQQAAATQREQREQQERLIAVQERLAEVMSKAAPAVGQAPGEERTVVTAATSSARTRIPKKEGQPEDSAVPQTEPGRQNTRG